MANPRAAKRKGGGVLQQRFREAIQRSADPIGWMIALRNGVVLDADGNPESDIKPELADRIRANEWLSDKLVTKPKPASLPGDNSIGAKALPVASEVVRAIEAESVPVNGDWDAASE